jgi:hypothetical protein
MGSDRLQTKRHGHFCDNHPKETKGSDPFFSGLLVNWSARLELSLAYY